ncbi:transporter substrate-binding domain-containing protein [Vibrio sp. JPW-9-11-11]|uniref:substrate-binding periplasmic protein n=1 Tax=Vibrio sp. JPW-9-11-11 TaxID=1416532 RepID=UPI001592B393|nr:transporter substrate-binding domain-containing protein [Vibrio sp. JPW-9-11-11]NVD06316.1 transporter substrate-binding domain-containing protein [Vibrio sp. JPW-9-11-11]
MKLILSTLRILPSLVLASSLSFSATVYAETLRVAQTEWPPFIMESPLGGGVAHDFIVDALVEAGYQVQFDQKPWSRILKETIHGKNDVIVAMWKTEEREQHFLFTDAYMNNQMAVVSRNDSDFNYTQIESLKGKEVALIHRYAYTPKLLEYPDMIPVNSIDLPNSLRLVLTERADVLVSDEIVARWTIKQMNIDINQLKFSPTYLDSTPLYAGVRHDHPQAQAIVNMLNQYFLTQGAEKLEQLKEKYGVSK